jgi:hypothetical protein
MHPSVGDCDLPHQGRRSPRGEDGNGSGHVASRRPRCRDILGQVCVNRAPPENPSTEEQGDGLSGAIAGHKGRSCQSEGRTTAQPMLQTLKSPDRSLIRATSLCPSWPTASGHVDHAAGSGAWRPASSLVSLASIRRTPPTGSLGAAWVGQHFTQGLDVGHLQASRSAGCDCGNFGAQLLLWDGTNGPTERVSSAGS